ncbi:MAG: glycosyltransferase family 25 protein [Verrucomicrobia bacterium]|nr:glycosyltransferase family 25 protein [Verrucomicrobiota bacterium]
MKTKIVSLLFTIFISSGYSGEFIDHLRKLDDKTPVETIRNVDYMYVINLDHRPEKYEMTMRELAPYGIKPYRFSAVNAWKLPFDVVDDVCLKFEKGMRPGGMGTVYRHVNGKEYHSHEIVEVEGTPYICHCTARGALGCVLSHLTVMYDALCSGYNTVWICEDDIEVVQDPNILSRYIEDLDRIVGRENWDVFYTFRDYRGPGGKYYTAYGGAYHPGVDTRDQNKYNINRPISTYLRQSGSRFGTQSMIWTRNGIKKVLEHYKKYRIFLPYDLELTIIPGIKMYSVQEDVVTNILDALSDLGSTNQSL